MARIIITTFGSSGDLNPLLAIALQLRARGHTIIFAVEGSLLAPVKALGFGTHQLPGDINEVYAAHTKAFFGGTFPARLIRYFMQELVLPHIQETIAILQAACAEADLFIASTLQFPASIVADLISIPYVAVAFNAGTVASSAYTPLPLATPPGPLRRPFNRLMWEMGKPIFRQILDRPLNAVRKTYGLPPRYDVMYGHNQRADALAVLISPAFVPPPDDWPAKAMETGFCFWDTPDEWQMPGDLTMLVDGTRPVVAMSLGSMAHATNEIFAPYYRAALTAIHQVGARALLIGVERAMLPDPLPPETVCLPYAPFSQIYPRCAVVIHHGGVGTVAQALRAGVPSLIVPWGADQFFDGAQVQAIEAGQMLPQRHFTVSNVAHELTALLTQAHYQERVKAIAKQIATEDGVTTFCAIAEQVLARSGTHDGNRKAI